MLKVKFVRIENVILMKVLMQGDEITLGGGVFFNTSDGFRLCSYRCPGLCANELHVLGTEEWGQQYVSVSFDSVEQAKTQLQKYMNAIYEYEEEINDPTRYTKDTDMVIIG